MGGGVKTVHGRNESVREYMEAAAPHLARPSRQTHNKSFVKTNTHGYKYNRIADMNTYRNTSLKTNTNMDTNINTNTVQEEIRKIRISTLLLAGAQQYFCLQKYKQKCGIDIW